MFAHHHRRAGVWRGLEVTPTPVMVATSTSPSPSVIRLPTPAGTASGDLLIAVVAAVSGTWTAPAAFTEQVDGDAFAIATRVADGSEAASFDFTCSTGSQNKCGGILRIPGAVFDVPGATSGSMTAPGITMTGDGILLGAYFDNSSGTSFGIPAGMTPLASVSSQGSMAIFTELRSAGGTGSRVSSGGDTSVLFAAKAA